MTYGIVSDIHAHAWSTFAKGTILGVNQRLTVILKELERAAQTVADQGGRTLVIAGDIFHTRGTIDPEVLNPMQQTIRTILEMGVNIYAIPGNHDLKSSDTQALSSAIETLGQTYSDEGEIHVINKPLFIPSYDDHYLGFVPWRHKTEHLLADLDMLKASIPATLSPDMVDVFIHAGIDGVLPGMPDHGLSPAKLAAFGFRSVFAGHYHNHKEFAGRIFSIGATTHQTWSDVGTKAGFLIVDDMGRVTYNASHAPGFVDISGMDPEEAELAADGNYVRFRGGAMAPKEVEELRSFLLKAGAAGVMISVTKTATIARSTGASKAVTLDESVGNYVDTMKDVPASVDPAKLKLAALDVLAKSRMVVEEA